MKCPKCGNYLKQDDIEDVHFRGKIGKHFAYVCKKCETIIGFGAYAKT